MSKKAFRINVDERLYKMIEALKEYYGVENYSEIFRIAIRFLYRHVFEKTNRENDVDIS